MPDLIKYRLQSMFCEFLRTIELCYNDHGYNDHGYNEYTFIASKTLLIFFVPNDKLLHKFLRLLSITVITNTFGWSPRVRITMGVRRKGKRGPEKIVLPPTRKKSHFSSK